MRCIILGSVKLFKKYWGIVLVIVVSIVPLFALLSPGLPITHDGQDHVARIANFYSSLSQGNIIPRWAENLNWGYGHPILMFLYPLPSYIVSLFHFLGFSLVDSTKLVFAAAFIASGITMYLWLRGFLGERSAIAGALLYNFAPYRFVDLYVRGAIGEHVAFVFPPLILYFLIKLSKRYSYWYILGGSVSLAGLILSHNAITLMFLPFIIAYAVYLVSGSKSKKLLSILYLLIAILGFGLSSSFLLPAFFEGKYTLRDIVTAKEYASRFVRLDQLIYGPWSFGGTGQFTVQLGIAQWLVVLGSLFTVPFDFNSTSLTAGAQGKRTLFRREKKLFTLYASAFIFFLASLFLMLAESNFIWQTITTLQKFQFPWRFLSISIFAASVLGAILVYLIKNEKIQKTLLIVVLIAAFALTINYWKPKGYLQKPETFYTGIYESTTDTGESSPRWSVRFMEKRPQDTIEVIEGNATIKKLVRSSTHHKYSIESVYSSRIVENTLYFPGWKVYIDGRQYKGVQFQDPNYRGLMTFYLNNGEHIVDVKFEDTKLRQVSNAASLLSIASLIMLGLISSKCKLLKIK